MAAEVEGASAFLIYISSNLAAYDDGKLSEILSFPLRTSGGGHKFDPIRVGIFQVGTAVSRIVDHPDFYGSADREAWSKSGFTCRNVSSRQYMAEALASLSHVNSITRHGAGLVKGNLDVRTHCLEGKRCVGSHRIQHDRL
ncbi:hypothetical protein D3C87_1270000 [compost metagenome]